MVQQQNVITQTVYFQMHTSNKSFLDMHYFLEAKGIQNNKFFLALLDPDLAYVNPRDPKLNSYMKTKILREVTLNYWYFLREVIRIPDQGGTKGSGRPYQLHRGNLAMNFCLVMNMNIFLELPRQQGKTISVICRMLWEFQFGTTNSQSAFINKKHDDSKENLQRLKDYRDALPSYLQMSQVYGNDGKKLKARDSVETLEHPINGNKIRTLPAARNKVSAMSLGRGLTLPRIWYDEYAFTPFNNVIYLSATPAFKTAAKNAKTNGAPYGILITTTPGDLTTEEGINANQDRKLATPFSESWYDMKPEEVEELISKNNNSSFVYIRYTYQQLGLDEEWFKSMCIDLKKDWTAIRREVLLEWAESATNSPFNPEDIKIVAGLVHDPIDELRLCRYYVLKIYERMDPRVVPIIGVDVSGGYNRDASAITVIDSSTTRVLAELNCNYISTVDLAAVIYELVTKYLPNAVVNVERNGGFGASVLAKLKNTRIKKNLYYEIKDKVVEERFNGVKMLKKSVKTKVFGLDNTHDVRNELMEILRERMENHKDKFISPLILSELKTLEVKKNGRIEHCDTGHDDQIFSYLMAMYVYYDGADLMANWNIKKSMLKTDKSIDEEVLDIEEKYKDLSDELKIVKDDEDEVQVDKQLEYLAKDNTMTFDQWMVKQKQEDDEALRDLLQNNKVAQQAYMEKYHVTEQDLPVNNSGQYTISNKVFNDFYK